MPLINKTVTIVGACRDAPGFIALEGDFVQSTSDTVILTLYCTNTVSEAAQKALADYLSSPNRAAVFSQWWVDSRKESSPIIDPLVNRINIQAHLPLIGPPTPGPTDPATSRWIIGLSRIGDVCRTIFPHLNYPESIFFYHYQTKHSFSFRHLLNPELTQKNVYASTPIIVPE